MRMKDIMNRSFECLKPGDDLRTVARLFRKTHLESLPVTDPENSRLIGIMTKANLYDALANGIMPDMPIRGLYTTDVLKLSDNLTYEEVKEIVRTSPAGNAIVVNDDDEVRGIFTKTGLIMAMLKRETQLNNDLNAILQTMYNGLLAVDQKGRIIEINKAAQNALSIGASDALGRRAADLLPGLQLDDVLMQGRPSVGYLYTIREISLLCNITPITREGSITGAIIVFQDVTDLMRIITELESVTKLNRTLQSVMNLVYDGIVVVDEKGCISMINQAAERFLRRNEDLIVGKPVDEIIENTRIPQVLKTGVPEVNHLQFIRGVPYVVSSFPIIRKGQVVGAVGKILFRNLDEVKDLARKLADIDQEMSASSRSENREAPTDGDFDHIITADPVFRQIISEAAIVSRGTSNILITGESGTGKELIARAIHKNSCFGQGPLVKVNCAAIPDSLMESEFFGYAPGAFTGAHRSGKKGKLAMADGGTLFLDEIGDMPITLQSKLLRVIQDKCFEPIGSSRTQKIDVRFIAATNRNIEDMVARGGFRPDLFYRLNVIHLHIPPLRERRQDINLLIQFFLEKYNRIFGTRISDVSSEVREIFLDHDWPGNVRELENVIERGINFARGETIEKQDLPHYLRSAAQPSHQRKIYPTGSQLLRPSREDHERELVLDALKQANGNRVQAAKILGISRSWLYEKMTRMGITNGKYPV
ncbi:MAG TPA: sigma 54-interacting transcriptional regulator [Deltaproteobacteria bacterium]|nr:sigma 54-interacting transcriptional regulator [Deltaproteobacteria bacterium]HQI00945.1 sigma 54-interacting transcriptional regulator [Deltaproteobacteria bacterium]HQJ07467.1 sigma 54-interacting transcriptional regulator [Deltaproteobacteria bacterium]